MIALFFIEDPIISNASIIAEIHVSPHLAILLHRIGKTLGTRRLDSW